MIPRIIEPELLKLLKQFPVVAITGPRQVGKTTLAKSLIKKIKKKVIYLDLELRSDYNKLHDAEAFLSQHADTCVILDEVQRMPELFPLLRALIDKNRKPARFILLGSASLNLKRTSAESLAGRIAYKELMPFNLMEVPPKINMRKHWLYGGFPDAVKARNSDEAIAWLESFLHTYIEKDLPGLGMPASPQITLRLLNMLSQLHGQVMNYSNLSKSLALSVPTIKTYIDFLEGSYLVKSLPAFSNNGIKRLVKTPKYYIRDSGLLHRIAHINDISDLYGNILAGHSWEGYVIEQITERLPSGLKPHFYRTQDGSECDLLLTKGNKPVAAMEIKHSSAPTLSKGNIHAFEALKTKRNFIIIPETDDYTLKNGTQITALTTFLEKHLKTID